MDVPASAGVKGGKEVKVASEQQRFLGFEVLEMLLGGWLRGWMRLTRGATAWGLGE